MASRKGRGKGAGDEKPAVLVPESAIPSWRDTGIVFLVSLVARLIFVAWARSADPLFAHVVEGFDQHTYQMHAGWILSGDWLLRREGTFFYSPLYAYYVAGVYTLFGKNNFLALHLIQAVIGALTCAVFFRLAATWLSRRGALIAAAFWCCAAPLLCYEQTLLHESMIVFCHVVMLWLIRTAWLAQRPVRLRYALAGAVGILAMLGRNNALVLVLTFPLWLLWRRGKRASLAFALGAAIGFTPLGIRNKIVHGHFTSGVGSGHMLFYIGNGIDSTGELIYTQRYLDTQKKSDSNPNAFIDAFLEDLRAAPGTILFNLLRKAYYFVDARDIPDNVNFQLYRQLLLPLQLTPVQWEWLVPLGLFGLGLSVRWPRDWELLWFYAAVFAASIIIVLPIGRYRLPILIPITIWAAFAVEWFIVHQRARRDGAIALGTGAVLLLILVLLPWNAWRMRKNEFFTLSAAAAEQKRFDLARKVVDVGYEHYPDDPELLGQGLRVALWEQNRPEAERLGERLWLLKSFDLEVARVLVVLYRGLGRMDRVRELLTAIVQANPADAAAQKELSELK